jgi:hypothetical protein
MYRPWGLLEWTLGIAGPLEWGFVGCIGTEERSLAAWAYLQPLGFLSNVKLFQVNDKPSRYSNLIDERMRERLEAFRVGHGHADQIVSSNLMDRVADILEVAKSISQNNESMILDISSLPKRYFFVLLKVLLRAANVRNLILTYTIPNVYESIEPLCEDSDPWGTLPTFLGIEADSKHERLIVGVGFLTETIQSHLSSLLDHEAVALLIPFPAPISALRRSWEAVYHLEYQRPREKFQQFRVDAKDMSAAFERICSLTQNGLLPAVFAPFGPKPMSAAMAVYATLCESAVYYPQPKVYHPDYTRGVARCGNDLAIYGYWIKHDGQCLYSAGSPQA